jgi:hypothetical protein
MVTYEALLFFIFGAFGCARGLLPARPRPAALRSGVLGHRVLSVDGGGGRLPRGGRRAGLFQDVNCPELSEIESVEGEGYFEEDACCYPVTRRDNEDFFGGCFGVGVGVGPTGVSAVAVGASGVGGAGGVMTASGAGGIGGTGGAGGGSEMCTRCSEAINGAGNGELCEGSLALFNEFVDCMCKTLCADACASECSMGSLPSSMVCNQCVTDESSGCGAQFQACSDDF